MNNWNIGGNYSNNAYWVSTTSTGSWGSSGNVVWNPNYAQPYVVGIDLGQTIQQPKLRSDAMQIMEGWDADENPA